MVGRIRVLSAGLIRGEDHYFSRASEKNGKRSRAAKPFNLPSMIYFLFQFARQCALWSARPLCREKLRPRNVEKKKFTMQTTRKEGKKGGENVNGPAKRSKLARFDREKIPFSTESWLIKEEFFYWILNEWEYYWILLYYLIRFEIIVEQRYISHSTNECYVHIRVDVVGGSCRFIFWY